MYWGIEQDSKQLEKSKVASRSLSWLCVPRHQWAPR